MTFQPPPPPPGDTPPAQPPGGIPPAQPPGQWGPPPGGGYPTPQGGFDPKTVNPLDWSIVGAGVLVFILSFFDWYTVDIRGLGSGSWSAWDGFFGWFAVLLALAGSVLVAMEYFAPHIKLPISNRLAGLGCYAVATISIILALLVFPEDVPDVSGIDTSHGFGYWASLIVILAGLVLSLMRLQQTGGQLPGALGNLPNIGGHGGGPGAGPTPPAAPGYGPPPGA